MNTAEKIQDECDAPTRPQIYRGLEWTKDILVMRMNDIKSDMEELQTAHKALADAFAAQSMSGVKQASEAVVAASLSLQSAVRRTHDDASVLARKAKEHLNRRSAL